jgi:hypothetical protein
MLTADNQMRNQDIILYISYMTISKLYRHFLMVSKRTETGREGENNGGSVHVEELVYIFSDSVYRLLSPSGAYSSTMCPELFLNPQTPVFFSSGFTVVTMLLLHRQRWQL